MQFPWMMYCKGPGMALPHGQSVSCKAALDEKDYADAIKSGWFPSVPEALAEKLDVPEPVKESVPAEVALEVEEETPKDEEIEPSEEPESVDEPDEAPRSGGPRKS